MFKEVVLTALGLSALGLMTIYPVLTAGRHDLSDLSPQEKAHRVAQSRIETARLNAALGAIRAGDPVREAGARRVLDALEQGDSNRHEFARALALRGRVGEAYTVEQGFVRRHRFDLPNDAQMEFYAELAERAGHPEEAAWDRDREGDAGHFRVWKEGEEYMLADGLRSPAWLRDHTINRHMDYGLGLYPKHRAEIEAMRRELLGGRLAKP